MAIEALEVLPGRASESQPDGASSLGFIGSGEDVHLVSCGSDAGISIRAAQALSEKPTTTFTREAVPLHCLAISPTGKSFAVGDSQSSVKVGPCDPGGILKLTLLP